MVITRKATETRVHLPTPAATPTPSPAETESTPSPEEKAATAEAKRAAYLEEQVNAGVLVAILQNGNAVLSGNDDTAARNRARAVHGTALSHFLNDRLPQTQEEAQNIQAE